MFSGYFNRMWLIERTGWTSGRFGVILCLSSAWCTRAFEVLARSCPGVTGTTAGTMRILGTA